MYMNYFIAVRWPCGGEEVASLQLSVAGRTCLEAAARITDIEISRETFVRMGVSE